MASLALGVKFNPTLGGTTDWVYASAVTGYVGPAASNPAMVDGKTYRYRAESADLSQWEWGFGIYTASTQTIARTTITLSSTGAKVSFSAPPTVGIVPFPADVLQFDDAMSLTAAQQNQARLNLGINQTGLIPSLGDLNTYTSPGNWCAATNNCTNAPYAGWQGYLEVVIYSGVGAGYLMQRATSIQADGWMYVRVLLAGVWQPWQAIISTNPPFSALTSTQKDQAAVNLGVVRAIRVQVFSSSGTYTPDANLLYAEIEAVGAGGAGGGASSGGGNTACAGGGGAGSYSRKIATAATIGASQTVSTGTGGTCPGGTSAGGAGGDTSVGALCIGKGGSGGVSSGGGGASSPQGGAGGVAGTGDVTTPGAPGTNGWSNAINTNFGLAGTGGSSRFGNGGRGGASSGTAGEAGTKGGGGGGANAWNGNGFLGGAGGAGYVVITEYCAK
jgi:hypothetical protein